MKRTSPKVFFSPGGLIGHSDQTSMYVTCSVQEQHFKTHPH